MKIKDLINNLPKGVLLPEKSLFPAGMEAHGEDKILEVFYDSRHVIPGSIFVAISGYKSDGNKFIKDAILNGAFAVVVSDEFFQGSDFSGGLSDWLKISLDVKTSGIFRKHKSPCFLVAADCRKALAHISALVYNYPFKDIYLLGVTGTNGKTSITYITDAIWQRAGLESAIIGTIEYRWPGKSIVSSNTTPESRDLMVLLREIKAARVTHVAMEVSSHALYLSRVEAFQFRAAIFTNLTQDHLDFHDNIEDYFHAKEKLFQPGLLQGPAIINLDDPFGQKLAESVYEKKRNLSTLSFNSSEPALKKFPKARNYIVERMTFNLNMTTFDMILPHRDDRNNQIRVVFNTHLKGKFNVINCALAIIATYESGMELRIIQEALLSEKLKVPGRFEVINSQPAKEFLTVVDYAHTPDALKNVLESARELKPRRILTVFGCGGDRDRKKRPLMGKVVQELSDWFVITSDNPRTEDPLRIIDDIKTGLIQNNISYYVIPDRKEAIFHAISECRKGDILIIAGKGHEDYQILGEKKIHFDDREVAGMALAEK